jgi:hypothetical protein
MPSPRSNRWLQVPIIEYYLDFMILISRHVLTYPLLFPAPQVRNFRLVGLYGQSEPMADGFLRHPEGDARCAVAHGTSLSAGRHNQEGHPGGLDDAPAMVVKDSRRLDPGEFGAQFAAAWFRPGERFLKLECWQEYQDSQTPGSSPAAR